MRIIVAGILMSSLVLAACGTNQTEQSTKQPIVKQDNPVIEMEKQASTDMAMPETGMSESTELNSEQSATDINSDTIAESTSDNSMITDSGIQAEVKQEADHAMEEKAALVVEDAEKDQKADEEQKVN